MYDQDVIIMKTFDIFMDAKTIFKGYLWNDFVFQ